MAGRYDRKSIDLDRRQEEMLMTLLNRQPIPFDDLQVRTHHLWNKQWLLLTAGDFEAGRFNSMTIGWGSLGTMWGRPFAQVVVRPTRYTYEFMEKYDSFTVRVFGDLPQGPATLGDQVRA